MTVKELIADLQTRDPDAEVRIAAFGGMRSGKKLKDVSNGFDWDSGSVLLNPDTQLTVYTRTKPTAPIFAVGDRVRVKLANVLAEVIELRGPLGPRGAQVYRLKRSRSQFVEVREEQIELAVRVTKQKRRPLIDGDSVGGPPA